MTVTEVAYIGGAGRSGSTVLALLLGQMPGFVAAGGVSNLWERGLQQNLLCGCGVHFTACPFWTEVGREAFGGWSELDAGKLVQLKHEVARYRHLPWQLAPGFRPSFDDRVVAWSNYMGRVYSAIATVSGARVVIDTSHDPMSALLLRRIPTVNGRIVHLVRDPRAVAFSLSRRVVRAEVTAVQTYMPRYRAVPASTEWLMANLPFHTLLARALPVLRVNYESLTASPATEIDRVARFLSSPLSPADLSVLEAEPIEVGGNHMISGNPHRLGRTTVRVRQDDEWRTSMRARDRMIVTSITSPLGVVYGYAASARSASNRRGGRSRTA